MRYTGELMPVLPDSPVCSECFADEGLRLDAQHLGAPSADPCPNCSATNGYRLTHDLVETLAHRFFVRGSLVRYEYGAAPQIQFNAHQTTSIAVSGWLEPDLRLIERTLSVGFFGYGPRFWMFGEVEPLTDWSCICEGLEGVVLTRGDHSADGIYRFYSRDQTGSIEIPAWDGDLWTVFTIEYFEEHRPLFERLAVPFEPKDAGIECRFTLPQAKAFLLLHVFLHELGHHVDRMQSKKQDSSRRGEPFAEQYANTVSSLIWSEYVRVFGDPTRSAA
jgi:hypothetical protein